MNLCVWDKDWRLLIIEIINDWWFGISAPEIVNFNEDYKELPIIIFRMIPDIGHMQY